MHTRARFALLTLLLLLLPLTATAWDRGEVERFAKLPDGFAHPEGITVDDDGNVYVTTFDVTKTAGPGQLFVYNRHGHLLRQVSVQGSSHLLLDLAFHPDTGKLLIIDNRQARVLKVNPFTGASRVFTIIPDLTPTDPQAGPGPNVLTFDRYGNVYITDSFQGVIWRTGPHGGTPVAWLASPLLTTTGVPPFGANGLAFNSEQSALFVANTGNDTVIKIPVSKQWRNGGTLVPGIPAVFANSINGADGLIIDEDDNVWVAANQANEIVVLDPTGRTIAKLGDFDGIGDSGAPRGLLFPASLVRKGHTIYVTNLALDLRLFNPAFTTGDSQWAAQVTRHSIAKLRARIPFIKGLP
jgi:sugar lactone lactonase YvrE